MRAIVLKSQRSCRLPGAVVWGVPRDVAGGFWGEAPSATQPAGNEGDQVTSFKVSRSGLKVQGCGGRVAGAAREKGREEGVLGKFLRV